jgi:hypothetical protein
MTQMPPENYRPVEDQYAQQGTKTGMAVTSMVLGIIGAVGAIVLVGIPIGLIGLILGIIALVKANKHPQRYGGKGFAITGIVTGGLGGLLAVPALLVFAILMPSLGRARELANRSYCAANLRGIGQSMVVYSADNMDQYPTLPYAAYSSYNAGASATLGDTTADDTLKMMYGKSSPQNGSVLGAEWMLVLRNSTSPKQFICKSDPHATAPASLQDPGGKYFTNFQKDNQISYSFAYPYFKDGSTGPWWKNTTDSSLPIAADMAPLNGTGTIVRNVGPGAMPANAKSWNSNNHQGDGETVLFADAHTEFTRRPDIGQSSDNIYTTPGGKSVSEYGGSQPVKSPVSIETDAPPFDVYMVPTRNLNTGGL